MCPAGTGTINPACPVRTGLPSARQGFSPAGVQARPGQRHPRGGERAAGPRHSTTMEGDPVARAPVEDDVGPTVPAKRAGHLVGGGVGRLAVQVGAVTATGPYRAHRPTMTGWSRTPDPHRPEGEGRPPRSTVKPAAPGTTR